MTSPLKGRFLVFLQLLIVYVRQMLMIAPQGQAIGPAGLELPARARNRRKATVKI